MTEPTGDSTREETLSEEDRDEFARVLHDADCPNNYADGCATHWTLWRRQADLAGPWVAARLQQAEERLTEAAEVAMFHQTTPDYEAGYEHGRLAGGKAAEEKLAAAEQLAERWDQRSRHTSNFAQTARQKAYGIHARELRAVLHGKEGDLL